MSKPRLFRTPKEFVVVLALLLLLFVVHLGVKYYNYQAFMAKPFYFTTAKVLHSYTKTKNKKTYTVLKLQSLEGYTFYTTSHQKKAFTNRTLRLQLFPTKAITFKSFLGTFFVKANLKTLYPKEPSTYAKLQQAIEAQHTSSEVANFYSAIYLAKPLVQGLRDKVTQLGISHLVALSGFHLGILWMVLYVVLGRPYTYIAQRYAPYRFKLFDVGLACIVLLGVYVWFVGVPPSLLRAYAMVVVGWVAVMFGLELLSFKFLAFVVALLLVLVPSLSVSIGFWFSVAGVYYIYLLLFYFKSASNFVKGVILIPFGLFVLMLPVVHGFFGVTSHYQLTSPLLSLLFTPFYPLSFVLHLFGVGGVLDGALLWLFNLPNKSSQQFIDIWLVWIYLGLSLLAMRSKIWFYLLAVVALLFTLWLYLFV